MSRVVRSRTFKQAMSSDDASKRRADRSVAIRRNKRAESMAKRRHGTPKVVATEEDAGDMITVTRGEEPLVAEMDRYFAEIQSPSPDMCLHGAQMLRRLLSIEKDPPLDMAISKGAIQLLGPLLERHDNARLQFEAAWGLTNIASGTSAQTRTVFNSGVVSLMIKLMRSPSADVREQCIWCMGNIAGDCAELRDRLLEDEEALGNVLVNISQPETQSLLSNATWTLSNLMRGKPVVDVAKVAPALPAFPFLLRQASESVVTDTCWALSYLSNGTEKHIAAVIASGAVPLLVPLLQRGEARAVVPALRTLGNVISGTDEQCQVALDAGVLPALLGMADAPRKSVRKEAMWALSNVAAGTKAQAEAVLRAPQSVEVLCRTATKGTWEVKREAGYVLINLCTGKYAPHAIEVATRGGAVAMDAMLKCKDTEFLRQALGALAEMLKAAEAASSIDGLVQVLEESGVVDVLEDLQEHDDEGIFQDAQELMINYFGAEEDDGEDEDNVDFAPTGAENTVAAFGTPKPAPATFSFGAPQSTTTPVAFRGFGE